MDSIFRLAFGCLKSRADAEDVTQTVLLRLYQRRDPFAGEDHLKHWLVRVTLNECKRLRSNPWHRRTVPLESCQEPVFSDPERRQLCQDVMALPARYRVPLYLYYYEGYSAAEVGELLHLKVSTVQTRLARGRAKLKASWTEE